MATLEELISRRLKEHEALASRLAVYIGAPAVFYQRAPDDTAFGWEDGEQVPRIGFTVDLRSNPERKTNGVLAVNIFCGHEGVQPEELEPLAREALCGVFLTPEGSFPYSLAWASSEAFEWEKSGEGHTDTLLQGTAMLFDVYAFPHQAATDPDPVLAMNNYIREVFNEAVVIGDSAAPDVLEPTAERPAFYFREETSETDRETNTVVWVNAVLACHVFAAGEEGAWIQTLCRCLRLEGEVTMLDRSPMFMRNVRTDSAAAALSAGQIRLHVRYGLLRMYEPVPVLHHAHKKTVTIKKEVKI